MATAEATARLLRRAVERGALHALNMRALGPNPTSLSVSALGFGAYRVGGGEQETAHVGALRSALRAGVNLIDTSSHYSAGGGQGDKQRGGQGTAAAGGVAADRHGASERLVGQAIAEAVAAGEVEREGLVVCTKVGHVAVGAPVPPGAVPIGPPPSQGGAEDVWHSIHPDFVDAEVRACRERLGTPPDFVLLHNPEYFLSSQLQQRVPIAEAWDEMYARLADAFEKLEALCDEGIIASGYGVSGNFLSCYFSTTGRGNLYEALALDRTLDAAVAASARRRRQGVGPSDAAGGPGHRLRLAQLPLNAVESGAVLGRGAAVPEAAQGDCSLARKLGIALVANRPLNALPLPGVSSGDWGRSGPTHWRLRDAKPMGAVESLLRRVIREAVGEGGAADSAASLQRLALKLVLSAPEVVSCLNGMRSEAYVADAAVVLREPPFSDSQVLRAMRAVRSAAEELGCEKRGLW